MRRPRRHRPQRPSAFERDNVLATARLAQACRERGVRLLFVSTVDTLRWGTRADPADETPVDKPTRDSTYASSKRRAEALVAEEMRRGLDAVIVHPAFLIGPWDWKPSSGRLLLAAVRGPVAIAPPGGNDFCHAAAVAETLLDLARAPSRPPSDRYILSGEALTYAEAFRMMRTVAGKAPAVITAPAPLSGPRGSPAMRSRRSPGASPPSIPRRPMPPAGRIIFRAPAPWPRSAIARGRPRRPSATRGHGSANAAMREPPRRAAAGAKGPT